MSKIRDSERVKLVYGALNIFGHAIAKSIERTSDDALKVDHGSLYPALQRAIAGVLSPAGYREGQ